MSHPVGGPDPANTPAKADMNALRMQVNPDNVLLLRNGLKAEAQYMRIRITAVTPSLHVGEPGMDPLSPWVAAAFNYKIGLRIQVTHDYADALDAMGDEMERTAKSYGITDDQIKDSFQKFEPGYQAMASVFTERQGGLFGGPR
jgi:hypothetical protein